MLLPVTRRHDPARRLLDALRPRDHLDLRNALRRLVRDADALVVALVVEQGLIEFAGDDVALPRRVPDVDRTVPCYTRVECRDGATHDVAVMKVRIAPRWQAIEDLDVLACDQHAVDAGEAPVWAHRSRDERAVG